MNDYNIELIFSVWIKDEKKHIFIRNDLREQIFETLTKNNVDMPYETVSVIMDRK
jgi:small conductance mechanosensitive channel